VRAFARGGAGGERSCARSLEPPRTALHAPALWQVATRRCTHPPSCRWCWPARVANDARTRCRRRGGAPVRTCCRTIAWYPGLGALAARRHSSAHHPSGAGDPKHSAAISGPCTSSGRARRPVCYAQAGARRSRTGARGQRAAAERSCTNRRPRTRARLSAAWVDKRRPVVVHTYQNLRSIFASS
jgi:hypothetical protein